MKQTSIFTIVVLLLSLGSSALAMDERDLQGQPGYVDFSDIEIPEDAGKVTEVDLDPALLLLATKSKLNGDAKLSEALLGITSIRVKAFEIEDDQAVELRPIVERIESQLKRDGWRQLVRAKDGEELAIVSMMLEGDRVVGLLVMALEEDEAAFVNIVGDINVTKILSMGRRAGGSEPGRTGRLDEEPRRRHRGRGLERRPPGGGGPRRCPASHPTGLAPGYNPGP